MVLDLNQKALGADALRESAEGGSRRHPFVRGAGSAPESGGAGAGLVCGKVKSRPISADFNHSAIPCWLSADPMDSTTGTSGGTVDYGHPGLRSNSLARSGAYTLIS